MYKVITFIAAITIASFAVVMNAAAQTKDGHTMAGMSPTTTTTAKKKPVASGKRASSTKKRSKTAAKSTMKMSKQPPKGSPDRMKDGSRPGEGMHNGKEMMNMDKPRMNKGVEMMKKKPAKKAPAKPKAMKMDDMDMR